MKPLEDAFATDVFRRVVLPGIVLSAALHPLISHWIPAIQGQYGVGPTTLIVAEIIVLGLGISSATQWIYYVYEGFRLEWLTKLAGRFNRSRLARKQHRLLDIQGNREFDDLTTREKEEVTKIYEYLTDFPLVRLDGGSTTYFPERPTRLGNIIATYELYAESRYGVDGVDFWYHFLNLAPDATRKEFDEKYSFAESMVLASFAGALAAALHFMVLVGFAIGKISVSLVLFRLSTGTVPSVLLMLFGLLVWFLFYLASLPAHREAGAALRALIDLAFPKFVDWATTIQVPPSKGTVEKIAKVNEYLKRPDHE
jgi:hypothetical protein